MTPAQAARKAAKAMDAYEQAMNLAHELQREAQVQVPTDQLWDVHKIFRELRIELERAQVTGVRP